MYVAVEGEPFLSACEAWRERWKAAYKAFFDFGKSLGSKGVCVGFDGKLYGLAPVSPLPTGWKLSGRQQKYMAPRADKSGAEARASVDALPACPSHSELADLVGCPTTISYSTPTGSGSFCIGTMPIPVQLLWDDGTPLVLVIPDAEKAIADLLARAPEAAITHGAGWQMPDGLRRISEAKWGLMKAQAAVARERAA